MWNSLQWCGRSGRSSRATALLRSTLGPCRLHFTGPLVSRRRHIRNANLQRRCSTHAIPKGSTFYEQSIPRAAVDELYPDNFRSGCRDVKQLNEFQSNENVLCFHSAPLLDARRRKRRRSVLVSSGLQIRAHNHFHRYSERYRWVSFTIHLTFFTFPTLTNASICCVPFFSFS